MGKTSESNGAGNIRRRGRKRTSQRAKAQSKPQGTGQQTKTQSQQRPQDVKWQPPEKKGGKGRVILIVAAVLLAVAVIAFAVVYYVRQNEEPQEVKDGPTIPRVSFYVGEHKVNTLAGYKAEMDIPSMRDTITPTAEDGQLKMEIESDGQELGALKYELRSLNGSEQYTQTTISSLGSVGSSTFTLNLRDILERDVREAVLVITLQVGEQEVHYYTRVARPQDLTTTECLEFAKDFHEKAFNKKSGAELETYLEPGEKSDNTTLQTVNIYSNVYHIRWGELKPQMFTEPEWSIKESNTVYSSILAKYQVICAGDNGEQELFNVREFFRVRKDEDEDKMYLLDYERTMSQVFNASNQAISGTGIRLGMIAEPVDFEANEEGNVVCFVQERELWSFNKDDNQFTCIFSFADDLAGNTAGNGEDGLTADGGDSSTENGTASAGGAGTSKKNKEKQPVRGETDARLRNDEHDVRIIHIADDGSVTFAVDGYMNGGNHEGEVGVDIFYYDAEEKTVEERAFLPSTKSFAVTEYELGKLVYYSEKSRTLYVLNGGVLYQMGIGRTGQQKVLAEGLLDGQYVVSEDGHLLAWQKAASTGTGNSVQVLNLETEETFEVKAAEGEFVSPLGFVYEDFICGYANELDAGALQSGEFCIPMHRLEIRSLQNSVVKEYEPAGTYILDIDVSDNLVTINRVARVDGVYSMSPPDYISNNEGRGNLGVTLETYNTDLKERQKRITFGDGLEEEEVGMARAKQVPAADSTISLEHEENAKLYYVFGHGRLAAIYENAGQAIRMAEEVSGVVMSWNQSYVWEKGNRDLSYYTDVDAFSRQEGQSSLDSCLAYMERYGEIERMDLSGCEFSQVLYVVNQGMPVIVMTDTQHAILLTGYNVETATYVDPDSGVERTVVRDEMERMVAAGGNTFIGFVK